MRKHNESPEKNAELTNSMNQMKGVLSGDMGFCRTKMMELKKSIIFSVFALFRAEDIWSAIETILYSSGRKVTFQKRGDLPEIRAKQIHTRACH